MRNVIETPFPKRIYIVMPKDGNKLFPIESTQLSELFTKRQKLPKAPEYYWLILDIQSFKTLPFFTNPFIVM